MNGRGEFGKVLSYPGVYIVCKTNKNIDGNDFSWFEDIVYIGMTNSKNGLKGRLKQFDNTISKKQKDHGGAQRVLYKHPTYDNLVKNLFVSIRPFECNVSSNNTEDLRIMGKVSEFEYICFAEYVEKFKRLPEFNDKKRSPKQQHLKELNHAIRSDK